MQDPNKRFRFRQTSMCLAKAIGFCLLSIVLPDFGLAQDVSYYARNPSGYGPSLVFEFNGRIWLQEQGRHARRVTDGQADEASPMFSPDGKHVAFTALDGNAAEIFLTTPGTGDIVRLTYDGGPDAQVEGWLGSSEVLYSTTIMSKKRGPLLFVIDIETRKIRPVPLAEASEGCLFKGSFIFVKNEKLVDKNRLYRGGYAQSIYKIPANILSESTSGAAMPGIGSVHLTSSYLGISRQPLCAPDRIYFLSDRSG